MEYFTKLYLYNLVWRPWWRLLPSWCSNTGSYHSLFSYTTFLGKKTFVWAWAIWIYTNLLRFHENFFLSLSCHCADSIDVKLNASLKDVDLNLVFLGAQKDKSRKICWITVVAERDVAPAVVVFRVTVGGPVGVIHQSAWEPVRVSCMNKILGVKNRASLFDS